MKRKSTLIAVPALVVALGTSAVATAERGEHKGKRDRHGSHASFTYTLPGDNVFPEGIVTTGKRFFVTATGDGTIFKGRRNQRSATVFLPGGADGRTTAIGINQHRGLLYVAGGNTGFIWVYDIRKRSLVRRFATGPGGFINDIAVTRGGTVYATDSGRAFIYEITREQVQAGTGDTTAPARAIPYAPFVAGAFNANGIERLDGQRLIVVSAGKLYRFTPSTGAFEAIDTGGADTSAGDGLVVRGRTLWVVRNSAGRIAKFRLSDDFLRATVIGETADSTFRFPTTADRMGKRLLVVNSQFNRRAPGMTPELPFTVSNIRLP